MEYDRRLANNFDSSSTIPLNQDDTSTTYTNGTSSNSSTPNSPSPTVQRMSVKIADNALLLLLVDPVTCFRDASYTQHQIFHLEPSASLILLDWITAGRISRGEEWDFARYHSINEVWVAGKRRGRDVLLLEQNEQVEPDTPIPLRARSLKESLAPYTCYATVMMFGPLVKDIALNLVRMQSNLVQMQSQATPSFMWSISEVQHGGCSAPGWVLRVVGVEREKVRNWLREAMRAIERAVGKEVYSKAFV
ncbi:hypothetical protein M422DRAFT_36019 [Sphaerobolus stellatus SS14]|uniref:Unplaced genomic scaffold SPHSTscaffold_157, whole genome shotgun sequence n=1 Tax=Sphaerobolus stellatus (strain SS14) TaxID=990650 RepID=A0A0C9UBS0_SPHS4|nr:hypothetical protein M422DRAFT_36019 [Sphaerobolus stellatus SS14]